MAEEINIETTRAAWAASEQRLYPMVASNAEQYQKIVVAVRALADETRLATSIEQLATMWPNAHELLLSALSTRGLPTSSLPLDQIAGAAFALREREIKEQNQRQAQQENIDAARRSGEAWVVLAKSGKLESGLFDPYQCTEMHVASGLAVMSLVQPDPSSGLASFVMAVIKLDPLTGALLDAEPGIEDWTEHAQQEDFVAHRDAVRDRISSMTIENTQ